MPIICDTFRDQIPVSDTTLYSYVKSSLLKARNRNFRRKVSCPKREKRANGSSRRLKMPYRKTYKDYEFHTEENPVQTVSQIDLVVIHKGWQVILTILFTNCDLQLGIITQQHPSTAPLVTCKNTLELRITITCFRWSWPTVAVNLRIRRK